MKGPRGAGFTDMYGWLRSKMRGSGDSRRSVSPRQVGEELCTPPYSSVLLRKWLYSRQNRPKGHKKAEERLKRSPAGCFRKLYSGGSYFM